MLFSALCVSVFCAWSSRAFLELFELRRRWFALRVLDGFWARVFAVCGARLPSGFCEEVLFSLSSMFAAGVFTLGASREAENVVVSGSRNSSNIKHAATANGGNEYVAQRGIIGRGIVKRGKIECDFFRDTVFSSAISCAI